MVCVCDDLDTNPSSWVSVPRASLAPGAVRAAESCPNYGTKVWPVVYKTVPRQTLLCYFLQDMLHK